MSGDHMEQKTQYCEGWTQGKPPHSPLPSHREQDRQKGWLSQLYVKWEQYLALAFPEALYWLIERDSLGMSEEYPSSEVDSEFRAAMPGLGAEASERRV